MMLTGSIRRFRVADVLQFLASQESTGILEIRDFEEYGFIYLIERGLADEDAIRRIMIRQTYDQVFELAHWRQGMFLYDEVSEEMPVFAVKVQGNVTELLLDAYRRIDEGERSRKEKEPSDCEVCFRCPTQGECSDLIRVRFLKPDHCLWREMAAVLDEDHDQLRNARNLYRSRQGDTGPQLVALTEGAIIGPGVDC